MADETVTIKIKVNADTREIEKVKRKLAELAAESRLAGAATKGAAADLDAMSRSSDRLGDSADKSSKKLSAWSRVMDRLNIDTDKFRKNVGKLASALNKAAMFGLKVFAIQTVLLGAGLASVSAAFKVGQAAAKAWTWAMTSWRSFFS